VVNTLFSAGVEMHYDGVIIDYSKKIVGSCFGKIK